MIKCSCGGNVRILEFSRVESRGYYPAVQHSWRCKCSNCGREGFSAQTRLEAKEAWLEKHYK